MTKRYSKQRKAANCGPVALLNVLKFMGSKWTNKDLPVIEEACKCDEEGTDMLDLVKATKVAVGRRATVHKEHIYSLCQVMEHVAFGDPIILRYRSQSECYHYATILPDEKNPILYVRWLNSSSKKPAVIRLTPEKLEATIQSWSYFGDSVQGIFITIR